MTVLKWENGYFLWIGVSGFLNLFVGLRIHKGWGLIESEVGSDEREEF